MTVSRLTFGLISIVALLASWWTAYHFVLEQGGDWVHAWATPACLELAALAAASRYNRTKDGVALLLFLLLVVATLAVNAAYGYPSWVLMAVYMLPPAVAVGVGHLLLRDLADARAAAQLRAREEAQRLAREADDRARREAQQAAQRAAQAATRSRTASEHSNGHKVRTGNVTADMLAELVPDTAAYKTLAAEHGTVQRVADHLEVTRGQLQAHRRRIGDLKT